MTRQFSQESHVAIVSVCMVSLNAWAVLQDCLVSLGRGAPGVDYEVIIVDNASTDGTPERLGANYPHVHLIRSDRNIGFTRATNLAIAQSTGEYLLWLNTDTILQHDTIPGLVDFLEAHPRAGIVGPKVLNADGTFQPQCRRGMPTPLALLLYKLQLDRLWPSSRLAGQYLLTYLPVDKPNRVEAVSGCCLLSRRQVWDDVGPLDEAFFGFGEDLDWCIRARDAGWEVWYYPGSQLIHLKGQGGVHTHPYHKIWGIHQAMWVFYRKHLRRCHSWPVTAAVWLGTAASLAASVLMTWASRLFRHHRPRRLDA